MMMISVLQLFCTLVDTVVRWCGLVAASCMPLLSFVVAFEVFSRYILNSPTIWAFDLSLFFFGYIAALGGAYAQQQRAHINVDILYFKVSQKTRCVFNLFSYSLAIFFLVIIFQMCFGKYEEAIEFDFRRESEWAPPMFHFWVMMCVATALFIAQLFRDLLAEIYMFFTGNALMPKSPELTDIANIGSPMTPASTDLKERTDGN